MARRTVTETSTYTEVTTSEFVGEAGDGEQQGGGGDGPGGNGDDGAGGGAPSGASGLRVGGALGGFGLMVRISVLAFGVTVVGAGICW